MISVLIATKNRSEKLKTCLQSVLRSSYQNFEVLLIDQSTTKDTERIVTGIASKKIRYVRMNSTGKAKALNFAVRKSQYEILAFTDDDCVVTKNWLKEIHDTYRHAAVAGVFGNTYAYRNTQGKGKVCVATFQSKRKNVFSRPDIIHYRVLGQGNNMSLKKSAVTSAGMFKEWLGVGSPAKAGEESELIFRILKTNRTLMTNPNMVVFHNRWLSRIEERMVQSLYTRGLLAFYAYYYFTADGKITWTMTTQRLRERLAPAIQAVAREIRRRPSKHTLFMLLLTLSEIANGLYGVCIGLWRRASNNI